MASSLNLATPQPTSGIAAARVLLSPGGPAAVAGLVVAADVDAVDRMVFAGPRPHVGEEVQEVLPLRTHGDATSAVGRVRGVSWVLATASHCGPGRVRDGAGKAMLVGRRLRAGVRREFGAGLGPVRARESGRAWLERSAIAQRVLGAFATRRTFEGLAVFRGKLPALEAGADVGAALFGHRVTAAPASGLASPTWRLRVAVAGAVRRAFRHTASISGLPDHSRDWRLA